MIRPMPSVPVLTRWLYDKAQLGTYATAGWDGGHECTQDRSLQGSASGAHLHSRSDTWSASEVARRSGPFCTPHHSHEAAGHLAHRIAAWTPWKPFLASLCSDTLFRQPGGRPFNTRICIPPLRLFAARALVGAVAPTTRRAMRRCPSSQTELVRAYLYGNKPYVAMAAHGAGHCMAHY